MSAREAKVQRRRVANRITVITRTCAGAWRGRFAVSIRCLPCFGKLLQHLYSIPHKPARLRNPPRPGPTFPPQSLLRSGIDGSFFSSTHIRSRTVSMRISLDPAAAAFSSKALAIPAVDVPTNQRTSRRTHAHPNSDMYTACIALVSARAKAPLPNQRLTTHAPTARGMPCVMSVASSKRASEEPPPTMPTQAVETPPDATIKCPSCTIALSISSIEQKPPFTCMFTACVRTKLSQLSTCP
mmetsp:Transcript_6185/g.13479  ORF Transcript_6185/g.13479 Transcript_6185/m.13479 type:complete len:241 (-) Transcript_6185:589-1311(-)